MGFVVADNLDATTGHIYNWTPTAKGTGQLYMTVTDSNGTSHGYDGGNG